MKPANSALICVGPMGIGYYAVVDNMPQRDSGVCASHGGAILVCDAAIVASELAPRCDVNLITNNVGRWHESLLLREHMVGRGVSLLEDSEPAKTVPFDTILLERSTGSRTFVTTEYRPKRTHIGSAIASLWASHDHNRANPYLYVDVELASPNALEVLPILEQLPFVPKMVLANLGDVSDLSTMFQWIPGRQWGGPTVFQVSAKQDILNEASSFAEWDGRHTVIITNGQRGAYLLSNGATHHLKCTQVQGSLTVGAGAIFSAAILETVISQSASLVADSMVGMAAEEASSFVQNFTEAAGRHTVFLW